MRVLALAFALFLAGCAPNAPRYPAEQTIAGVTSTSGIAWSAPSWAEYVRADLEREIEEAVALEDTRPRLVLFMPGLYSLNGQRVAGSYDMEQDTVTVALADAPLSQAPRKAPALRHEIHHRSLWVTRGLDDPQHMDPSWSF